MITLHFLPFACKNQVSKILRVNIKYFLQKNSMLIFEIKACVYRVNPVFFLRKNKIPRSKTIFKQVQNLPIVLRDSEELFNIPQNFQNLCDKQKKNASQ